MMLLRIVTGINSFRRVITPYRHFKLLNSGLCKLSVRTYVCQNAFQNFSWKSYHPLKLGQQFLHTSRPCYIHPVVALLLRPFARVLVVLGGRALRLWWQRLPKRRKHVVINHIHKNRFKYIGSGVVMGGAMSSFYWQHCQVCPVTQYTRFYLFQPEHMQQLDAVAFEEVLSTSTLLKDNSPAVRRVLRVGNKLVSAVKELRNRKWKIAVVDDCEMNAYCLSSGYIVIYTGMLDACENDHQLAAVLAHELAHVLLQHQNLKLSHEMVVDAAFLPLTFLAWCLGSSDLLSIAASWLLSKASTVTFLLPYSRLLEREADHFGLFIMAMACYDVREAPTFWLRMELVEEQARMFGDKRSSAAASNVTAWLSTHPSHEQRYTALDDFIPYVLKCRDSVQCPQLSEADPRDLFRKRRGSASDGSKQLAPTAHQRQILSPSLQ